MSDSTRTKGWGNGCLFWGLKCSCSCWCSFRTAELEVPSKKDTLESCSWADANFQTLQEAQEGMRVSSARSHYRHPMYGPNPLGPLPALARKWLSNCGWRLMICFIPKYSVAPSFPCCLIASPKLADPEKYLFMITENGLISKKNV